MKHFVLWYDSRESTPACIFHDVALSTVSGCVIKEGQRLYPAAPSVYRIAVEDDHINGYFVPAGTLIAYHVGAMMRWVDVVGFP